MSQKSDIEKCKIVDGYAVVEGHPINSFKDEELGSTKRNYEKETKQKYENETSYGWFLDSFRPQKIGKNGEAEVELKQVLNSRHIQVRVTRDSLRSSSSFTYQLHFGIL